jgi:hypothetical protein
VAAEGIGTAVVFRAWMNARDLLAWLLLVSAGLAGCASAPSQPKRQDPWLSLFKGMTVDQLRTTLGAPDEVRPMRATVQAGDVWTYQRTRTDVNLVAGRVENVPYIDPATGIERTVENPVYSQESRAVHEELRLLVFDGKLLEWRILRHTDRSYE